MATSRAWSNALIIGCTVVVAYAALVLGSIYAHRAHAAHMAGHAAPPHHGPPCMLERFAWLCAATGVTGMIAGCSLKKRWLYAFPVMLLLTELIILAHVSHGAVRAVERCTVEAERVNEVVAIERVDIAPGVALQRERAYVSRPYVDERARLGCVDGVRHAVFMACLVVGVVCSSLMCCGSRLAASLEREADAAAAANDTAVTAVVVMCDAEKAPLVRAKADPLAADEDEELATGKIALQIRRLYSRWPAFWLAEGERCNKRTAIVSARETVTPAPIRLTCWCSTFDLRDSCDRSALLPDNKCSDL